MALLYQFCLQFWRHNETTVAPDLEMRKIEDYKSGYPRFTALLSAHRSWLICRRFDKLRARILLLKQDRLSLLEQQLERIDQEETSLLFLGKSRCDRNANRLFTLSEIEAALADYVPDQFTERTNRISHIQQAQGRDITSLNNWVKATGCLAREETAYLAYKSDLMSLGPVVDSAVLQLETWVEDMFVQYWQGFRSSQFHDLSNDPNIYIYRGPLIQCTAKALLLFLVTLLLMMPVIICNLISTISVRIIIVMVSTISYLLILSWLTKSRVIELILAGATYATVLIVFVSGTTVMQN